MKKDKKENASGKYEAPRLKKYGSLRKITRGSAAIDRDDGGANKSWDKGCP